MQKPIIDPLNRIFTTADGKLVFAEQNGIITEELVLHLDASNVNSYNGSGTTWSDLSTNDNDGTLQNGVSFADNSFVFNGSDQYVSLPIDGYPYGSSPGTLSVWAKTTSASGFRWIVSYGAQATSSARFLGIYNSSFVFGGFANDVVASGVPLDQWFNLVGTYDGTTAKIYVNGSPIASTPKTWNTLVGTARVGCQVNSTECWAGNIASVMIYGKVLSGAEILQNFNATKANFGLL